MLAKPVGDTVPDPDSDVGGLRYDPKWDGFRLLVFHGDGGPDSGWDEPGVFLQSRHDGRRAQAPDLSYAFPEVVASVRRLLPRGCVLDGELVSLRSGQLHFEDLSQRLRPRSEAGGWKIAELSERFPASLVVFDLLAVGDRDVRDLPDVDRRARLEELMDGVGGSIRLSPTTRDPSVARRWFHDLEGAGLDGVIARPLRQPYQTGKRALLKVKHRRTADVVVAGWRPHKKPGPGQVAVVGSLLLGLYDEHGRLHHVGVASSFTAARRLALLADLEPHADIDPGDHPWAPRPADDASGADRVVPTRIPGGVSRWTGGKDLSWIPLRPTLVAEVRYDHMQADRFRHVATFQRWRPDRDPESCTYAQLEQPARIPLDTV